MITTRAAALSATGKIMQEGKVTAIRANTIAEDVLPPMVSKDGKTKVLPRTYTYDQYGNWTAVISESYLKGQTFQKKTSRSIVYY